MSGTDIIRLDLDLSIFNIKYKKGNSYLKCLIKLFIL
jgi:hypothetical protein